jgi:hypothetical protein
MFDVSSVCAFASFEEVTKLFEREFRAANVQLGGVSLLKIRRPELLCVYKVPDYPWMPFGRVVFAITVKAFVSYLRCSAVGIAATLRSVALYYFVAFRAASIGGMALIC